MNFWFTFFTCWAIRSSRCRSYLSCLRIYCVRCRSDDFSTFKICCSFYFRFCSYFDNCFCWFFRTNWLTYCWGDSACIRIHSISGCDAIFTILTFNSSWGCTSFFCIIFFIDNRGWYRSCLSCWFFRYSICSNCYRSYLTCFWINFISNGINHTTTFRIFRMFNLSFSTNFNDCLTCWGDDWSTKVLCDMTVLWIYIISGGSNCLTFFTLSTLIWCTEVFFNIFNVFHFWFNRRFYDFVFSTNFNDCIRWFFRTNWLTNYRPYLTSLRIYCVRCGNRFFSRSSCFSNWF